MFLTRNNYSKIYCPNKKHVKTQYYNKYKYNSNIIKRRVIPESNNLIIDNNIIFDYVDLYSKYICSKPSICSMEMNIPSLQEQYDILKNYYTIIHHLHNTHNLDGVILELLISKKQEMLDILVNSINEYNNSIDMIKTIVEMSVNENIIDKNNYLEI